MVFRYMSVKFGMSPTYGGGENKKWERIIFDRLRKQGIPKMDINKNTYHVEALQSIKKWRNPRQKRG